MCTESLGCETGSSFYSSFDEIPNPVSRNPSCPRNKPAKKICKKINFPPPLKSISGGKGLKMQSCREGGRLVIKASAFSSPGSCFKAERENGRLRLCLVKEKDEVENIDEAERDCVESEKEDDYNGHLWGGEWSSSRCNEDESGSKRIPSLPFCVAIS
ncbi:protein fantastic four 1 [Phtheirospermum japonicum]|uniref:Protein fantastic four 1 n=1 Tax=Phtheirospermum japonicum TaxID=374723 RepID=A0A830BDI1_9LAMI|nr:protein fantastic four 1 [Phtheirospermum japonicum]